MISAESENSGIYVGSLDSKERKRILSSGLKAAFAPPNHLLFVQHEASANQARIGGLAGAGGTLMVQQFDPKRFEIVGDPVPIADVGGNFGNSGAGFAVSEGAVLAYRVVVDPDRVMQWYDRTGKQLGNVDLPAPWESPSISPDLQRLAVLKRDETVGDLWILDQARGTTTRLTSDAAFDDAPVWSPEGAHIVFSSNRSGLGDLYLKNSAGTGQEEILLKSDHLKIPDDWSADGRFILYRDSDPKTNSDLWALPLIGDRNPQAVLRTPRRIPGSVFSKRAMDSLCVQRVRNRSGLRAALPAVWRKVADFGGRWRPTALATRRQRALLHEWRYLWRL